MLIANDTSEHKPRVGAEVGDEAQFTEYAMIYYLGKSQESFEACYGAKPSKVLEKPIERNDPFDNNRLFEHPGTP